MTLLRRVQVSLALLSATLFLCLAGCRGEPDRPPSTSIELDPSRLLENISTLLLQGVGGNWPWEGFISGFGSVLGDKKFLLDLRRVTYQSIGADGSPLTLSGLLILPRAIGGSPPAVPILMYQHTTEVNRDLAPSRFISHQNRPLDYPEVVLAAAIASGGYAVAMADYEGLGDNGGTHPYVHGASLARQTVDMLRASRDIIATTTGADPSPCTWNGQLFLMGYSEGGYTTMVATRDLQLNHPGEFTVTAAAALSGPHDLSGTMRQVILSDASYKSPYFIAFLLQGYGYAYQAQTVVFNPVNALSPPFSSTIPALFAGNPTASAINQALGMSGNPPMLVVPKTFLSTQFIQQLTMESSLAVLLLQENDAYRGWVPAVPLRMMHHPADELVPYANSQVAFNAFSSAGAKKWVSLVPEQAAFTVRDDPAATVHFSAALPELSEGFRWLDRFKK